MKAYLFALAVVRHSKTKKFLCVEETENRGYWLAGGSVEKGEDFEEALHREVKEEAGINVVIKGILRVEKSIKSDYMRMRIIFYCESDDDYPKNKEDKESVRALWCDINELIKLKNEPPYHRGPELLDWAEYINNGGKIHPRNVLSHECDDIIIN